MRLRDADELEREICRDQCEREAKGCGSWCELIAYIENAPAVDAVPVVRCKDCKWLRDSNGIDGFCYCDRIFRRCGTHWFCADGERRKSE